MHHVFSIAGYTNDGHTIGYTEADVSRVIAHPGARIVAARVTIGANHLGFELEAVGGATRFLNGSR